MAESMDLSAFQALAEAERLGDVVRITRAVVGQAAEARRAEVADPGRVNELADELGLARDAADTPYGNALSVLERAPDGETERALCRALAAHLFAERPEGDVDDDERIAADMLWLAAQTPFDATPLVDRAFGDRAPEIWAAVAERVRREAPRPGSARAEVIVGCAALASAASAAKEAEKLAAELKDPALVALLSTARADERAATRMEGELTSPPRGPVATALLGATGILFFAAGARAIARLALGFRRPAEVVLDDRGVRIKARTELLGRTLGEKEIVLLKSSLVKATREVRYPRLGVYAGLLALAIGSLVGVSLFVDGVRAASPSLLVWGLIVVALGIALDFALTSLVPGKAGVCHVAFAPKSGKAVCVSGVDVARADAALQRLK